MFDFTQRNRRVIQIVLFLIFLPFVFFGVDSYFQGFDRGQSVAKVGRHEISQQEFAKALQDRQRAMQRMLKGAVDPALLDNPELRQATLESLIQRRLLLERALGSGMQVSDRELHAVIGEVPLFRDESGKFSLERYRQFLKSEGETEVGFEARMRQDLLLQQLGEAYGASAIVPRSVGERVMRLAEQQREVSEFTFRPERYVSAVTLDAGAARKYYDANRAEFEIPEQVRLEYVVLTLEDQMRQVRVDPAEVARYYESRRAQFEQAESRARHILIAVDPAADEATKNKARATAEEVYAQLKKNPAAFPDLARKYSQDPGSAEKGGDLGFITRGTLPEVPEFEAALFKLKEGEISPPVATRLGFHVIQATEVRGARGRSLDELRGQIETELRKQGAAKAFAELAEKLNNTVYEQSESLKPAAELLKTTIHTSDWVRRSGATEPLLNNPRLLQAVFSEDVLRNRRNSEVVEVAPGTLVAARVLEHRPAALQPFETVSVALAKKLTLRAAARLAAEEGKAKLAALRRGEDAGVKWGAAHLISRSDVKGLPEPVARQAFRVDAARLPGYAGVERAQDGYTLVRVTRVVDAADIAADRRAAFAEALGRARGQEEMSAYVASLRQNAGITIRAELLEKK
ncbi:MAG: SurA N-terminal domain-containing protein [Burkholderiales bacterium]|nr:SurA N-terminal domain-containing protein [Burkholderiales bacterium]